MSGDNKVPSIRSDAGGLIALLRNLDLPEALQKSFLGALHRLVAGATDYPAAWLERAVQGVRDGTAARKAVSEALASLAAIEAQQDSELAGRAVSAWLPEAVRKQTNREAVARAAAEAIGEMGNGSETATESIDPDWMNMFVRFAEDASSDRMRELWGRVLAKEATRVGSFSLRTVRFMSELDAKTASAFERIAGLAFDGDAIDLPAQLSHDQFADIFLLEQAGLVSYGGGKLGKYVDLDESGRTTMSIRTGDLHFTGKPNHSFSISCTLLTDVGEEVLSMLPNAPDRSIAESLSSRINKVNLTQIEWDADRSGQREVFWSSGQ